MIYGVLIPFSDINSARELMSDMDIGYAKDFVKMSDKTYDDICTKDEETCKCGHHTNDHSYNPKNLMNDDLNCDKCECVKFVPCVEDVE